MPTMSLNLDPNYRARVGRVEDMILGPFYLSGVRVTGAQDKTEAINGE